MVIPFVDLPAAYHELRQELDAAYRRVAEAGWFILGEEVETFEREFAGYCGAKHCVGVASGLDALHLILRAEGIGPGDEVIVPANTFIATWLSVSASGATPVPVDVDPATGNMDPDRIPSAVTKRTRAVLPVHLYGLPADIDRIREAAEEHGATVIEDAAQAHGARYKGRRVGCMGKAGAFSFHPTKNLGALGDGGAVVTNDSDLADRVRDLRNYGARTKYVHTVKGTNSRLDALQAAFLRVKLGSLDAWNARRGALAHQYLQELADARGVDLPRVPPWANPCWHLFTIRHLQRDALQASLRKARVEALIHYPVPPHLSEAYAESGWKTGDFPVTERIAKTILTLPMGPHLRPEQVSTVTREVQRFCREA